MTDGYDAHLPDEIRRALEESRAQNSPRVYDEPEPYDLYDATTLSAIPPLVETIEGRLTDGAATVIAGPSGTFKTFVALDLGCRLATGMGWAGRLNTAGRELPVLYVPGEGVRGLKSRVAAWQAWRGRDVSHEFVIANFHPGYSFWRPGDYGDPGRPNVGRLLDLIEKFEFRVVILDTLSSLFVGADDNSSRDVPQIAEALLRIRDAAGHALLVHHTGKDVERGGRGHSSLFNNTDETWLVSRSEDVVKVTTEGDWAKRKDGPDWTARFAAQEVEGTGSLALDWIDPATEAGKRAIDREAEDEELVAAVVEQARLFGRPESKTRFKEAVTGEDKRIAHAIEAAVRQGLLECYRGAGYRGADAFGLPGWTP